MSKVVKLPKWYEDPYAKSTFDWFEERTLDEIIEMKVDFESRLSSDDPIFDYQGWSIDKIRFEAMKLRTRVKNLEKENRKLKSDRAKNT